MEEQKNKYVVYGHYYNDELFYIGSGKIYEKEEQISRPYDFYNSRSKDWLEFCNGEIEKIKVEILFETTDKQLARDREAGLTFYYDKLGRPLVNKRYGNYMTEEEKKNRSGKNNPVYGTNGYFLGRKHSAETKKKMSKTLKEKGINGKKVLIENRETGEQISFLSIQSAHEFVTKEGYKRAYKTFGRNINKGSFVFKHYKIELG